MEIRSLGYRTDLALLELTGSVVEDRGTHLVVRTPDNPSYFWGNFILLAQPPVPGGEQEVVGAFHTEFPQAEHVSIGIDGTEAPSDLQGWRNAGLAVDDVSVMTASSLTKPRDVEAEIRPLTSDADWSARERLSYQLYPDMPGEETFMAFARGKSVQEKTLIGAGRGQRFGAFIDGALVSTAAIFRTDDGLARYQDVETHTDHRRQGLASAVVHAAGQHALEALGATNLVIVAGVEGGAIGIYQAMGFADVERQVFLEKQGEEWRSA